jgi:ABC-type multidrug transport system ATPase subunit
VNQLLTVAGVTKRFKRRCVLNEVSFSVRRGEVLGLIGPNGAGKTTLFECLAGLMPADGGTLRRGDKILSATERKATLFYLPDAILPWAEQKVSWALHFFGQLYRPSRIPLTKLIAPLRLDEIMKARMYSLSKGERKRLLLALALLTPHELLMLDEPFDGLDLRQTKDVMALLKSHAAEGRALLLSIHQLADAGRVCDRLVMLSSGKVVGEGSLDELRAQASLANGGVEEIFLALT